MNVQDIINRVKFEIEKDDWTGNIEIFLDIYIHELDYRFKLDYLLTRRAIDDWRKQLMVTEDDIIDETERMLLIQLQDQINDVILQKGLV